VQAAAPAAHDLDERARRIEAQARRAEEQARGIGERLRDLEGRPAPAPADLEPLRANLGELRETVEYLLKRVEFVRQETLFEVRYGARPGSEAMEPRVIDAEKVARARREGLRLNIGCGHIPLEGYVNVDVRELPGVDVVAEATRLPFDPGTVTELFCAHLLEHFPEEQLKREVLPYWRSLLRDGGELRCVVPDAASMIERFSKGGMPFEDLREVTFGGQDYDGDFHYTMFSPESLKGILAGAGFGQVRLTATGRENGKCLEMEAVGVR
jgi:predicted SAM-dependent methyltransferase